jgi:hypothetical protein
MNLFRNLDEDLPDEDKHAFKAFVIINCCLIFVLLIIVCYKVSSFLILSFQYKQTSALVLEKSIDQQALNNPNYYRVRLLLENEIATELETPVELTVNQVIPVYYKPTLFKSSILSSRLVTLD